MVIITDAFLLPRPGSTSLKRRDYYDMVAVTSSSPVSTAFDTIEIMRDLHAVPIQLTGASKREQQRVSRAKAGPAIFVMLAGKKAYHACLELPFLGRCLLRPVDGDVPRYITMCLTV